MLQGLFTLRAANQPAGATRHRFALHALHIGTANRAVGREYDVAGIFRTFRKHHVYHLRDHISGAADHDLVANTQAKTFDFVSVMQRGVADQHTGNLNRFETRNGRDSPGPAHLKLHVAYKRHLLLRRKFKGHSPAWRARHKAQLFL